MIDSAQCTIATDKQQAFINSRPDRHAGRADSQGVNQRAGRFLAVRLQRCFESFDRPFRQCGDPFAITSKQCWNALFRDSFRELFFVVDDLIAEEVRDVQDVAEELQPVA